MKTVGKSLSEQKEFDIRPDTSYKLVVTLLVVSYKLGDNFVSLGSLWKSTQQLSKLKVDHLVPFIVYYMKIVPFTVYFNLEVFNFQVFLSPINVRKFK